MTAQQLNLQLEEPGDDHLCDQVFDILRDILQPNSMLPVEAVVAQLTALLPKGRPYSSEVGHFLQTCYEVAEQIPHNHVSMIKLVTLVDLCLNSPIFLADDSPQHNPITPAWRRQKLGETLYDWCEAVYSDECPAKFINFQSFVARIYERGLLESPTLAMYMVQEAFERTAGKTTEKRNTYVKAALQHLLLLGDALYQMVVVEDAKPTKWRRWHEEVRAVAAEKPGKKGCAYSQEIIQLAGRAIVVMEAVERLKIG